MTVPSRFKVGQEVMVVDPSGHYESKMHDIVKVTHFAVASWSEYPLVGVVDSKGHRYEMLEFRFDDVPVQPSTEVVSVDEVQRLIDEAVAKALLAAGVDQNLNNYTVPAGHVLVLRTSRAVEETNWGLEDSTLANPTHKVVSYYDSKFFWPEEFGAVVTCETYKPTTNCGNGLHGLKWGYGNHSFLNRGPEAVWQVIEVNEEEMVEINGFGGKESKVKFRTGRLIYTGDITGASKVLEKHAPVNKENYEMLSKATKLARRTYNKDFAVPNGDNYASDDTVEVGMGPFSNLVGSQLKDSDLHAPAFDIDVPHGLIESSTPGHGHLFFDVPMPWKKYKKLLKVMGECGILEEGYVKASLARKGSYLRMPWEKKQEIF